MVQRYEAMSDEGGEVAMVPYTFGDFVTIEDYDDLQGELINLQIKHTALLNTMHSLWLEG